MTAQELANWILSNFNEIVVTNAYLERSFFYNPNRFLPKGIYFATIKESDGPNDKSSKLDREGVFRLSIGLDKLHYQNLFGNLPSRSYKGGIINGDYDFTILGEIMPHPIYAWMGWIAINNPNENNLNTIKQFLEISYENAKIKFGKKYKLSLLKK